MTSSFAPWPTGVRAVDGRRVAAGDAWRPRLSRLLATHRPSPSGQRDHPVRAVRQPASQQRPQRILLGRGQGPHVTRRRALAAEERRPVVIEVDKAGGYLEWTDAHRAQPGT